METINTIRQKFSEVEKRFQDKINFWNEEIAKLKAKRDEEVFLCEQNIQECVLKTAQLKTQKHKIFESFSEQIDLLVRQRNAIQHEQDLQFSKVLTLCRDESCDQSNG